MEPLPLYPNNIPERTVIFRHPAVSFKLDSRIRFDAIYIKEPNLADQKAAIDYYYGELTHASNSFKSFIIMNYNELIGNYCASLMSGTAALNLGNWVFLAFFHEDEETLLVKHKKSVDMIDLKTSILLSMQDHRFIQRFTLPLNHILTFQDVMPILLKSWGY